MANYLRTVLMYMRDMYMYNVIYMHVCNVYGHTMYIGVYLIATLCMTVYWHITNNTNITNFTICILYIYMMFYATMCMCPAHPHFSIPMVKQYYCPIVHRTGTFYQTCIYNYH